MSAQHVISRLMCETDMGHLTGGLTGGISMQGTEPLMTIDQSPGGSESRYEQTSECPEFSEEELQEAKRFVQMIGGAERARELVDTVADCEECLGLVGDDDDQNIEALALAMPEIVDLPTMGSMAAQFNPSHPQ